MTSRSSAGGAAAAGGVDYQALVGAYMAVHILAESALSPLWDLPETVTFEGLWAESGAAVDDVLVTTSARGHVFIQAKRTVSMSDQLDSTLGDAFVQFVKLYRSAGTTPFPVTNEKRALDPDRDRIVLATSATTAPLDHFVAVLRRLSGVGTVARPRDCTTTGPERTALARGIRLVRRCWRAAGGTSPSWQEIVPFLKLLRVTTLALDPDESAEQNAKYWLRDRILLKPTAAEVAWKLLKDKAIVLAKRKAGVERAELQRMLRGADMQLRSLRSYEHDIELLRGQTRTSLRELMRFSRIKYDGIEITIRRQYDAVIRKEADAASLLVIGDAGCGKSGLLAVFADQAQANGDHVIVLNAGELAAESLGQLRSELGLEHDLIDIIEHWDGQGPAFLVIDALDSAREERTAATLRRLVERVQQLAGRWRVVATIRKFDLKNGKHWQKILPGIGIRPYFDPAFDDVRHINIGVLTAADIDSLKDAAPSLHALIATAPPALAELLRVPFNLMLANELREVGGASDLAAVTTQLGLLDLYWHHRLEGSLGERTSYEATLRGATEAMLGARRLHVPLTAVTGGPPLETVLSRSVLVEQAGRLQYAHHILFDYAVERLLLRPDANATIARLERDRDSALAIGPSLKFWVEGLWERDPSRTAFWAVALQLASSSAPAIAKLVPGTVAAEKTASVDDCAAMIASISSDAGTRVFMFVADAITANATRVVQKRPNPWFFILDRAAASAPVPVLHRGAFLLHQLLDAISDPLNEELSAAGRFARVGLTQAWSSSVRNRSFVVSCIRAVARTFRSDTGQSESLLRKALETEHVQQYGHEELRWIADWALEFIVAPNFLIDLYLTTFRATASADEQTVMSGSQILGLTSNKKQDLEGAQWVLGQKFAEIAQKDLRHATTLAVRLANQYTDVEEADAASVATFELLGVTATVQVSRYSQRFRARDGEPEIVEEVARQLSQIAADAGRASELPELVRSIARNNRTSLVWEELVKSMERSREMFLALHELFFSKDALSLFSRRLIGALRAHQGLLTPDARAKVEQAILQVRDSGYGDITAYRLFEALGRAGLSVETLGWLDEQDKERARAAQELHGAQRIGSDEQQDANDGAETYILREMGMTADDLMSDANRTARTRTKELRSRVSALGETVGPETLQSIEQDVRALRDYLAKDPVHPALVGQIWGALAEATTAVAERGVDSVRDILLIASKRPEPSYNEERERRFATNPGWGSGQARLEAAPGLIAIGSRTDFDEVLDAIQNLARDEVSEVRFQIGRSLQVLAERHRELYWKLLDALAADPNPSVVAVLNWGYALWTDPPQGLALLLRTYERWLPEREQRELVENLFTVILSHALTSSNALATAIVDAAVDDVVTKADLISHAVTFVREALTMPRDRNEQATEKHDVRRRAIAFVERVTNSSVTVFRELAGQSALSAKDRERLGEVTKLLRDIAQEMYFASLAYDANNHDRKRNLDNSARKEKPDPQIRVRFYAEAKSILRTLADVGSVGSAHYLIETLASYIELVDPAEVFLLIAEAVRTGRRGGYQYESLAVKEIVAIVERYLADFRVIFMDDEKCREGLRDILDTFVEAGWPETHRLVYSLDSIYR